MAAPCSSATVPRIHPDGGYLRQAELSPNLSSSTVMRIRRVFVMGISPVHTIDKAAIATNTINFDSQ